MFPSLRTRDWVCEDLNQTHFHFSLLWFSFGEHHSKKVRFGLTSLILTVLLILAPTSPDSPLAKLQQKQGLMVESFSVTKCCQWRCFSYSIRCCIRSLYANCGWSGNPMGEINPFTCDSRVMWKMPSQALIWDRKAFPRPWPAWAPFTRPAMSTTLRKAGILLQGKT